MSDIKLQDKSNDELEGLIEQIVDLMMDEALNQSYEDYLLEGGARYGCDCGCGGDELERLMDEDYERDYYDENESLLSSLIADLPQDFIDKLSRSFEDIYYDKTAGEWVSELRKSLASA